MLVYYAAKMILNRIKFVRGALVDPRREALLRILELLRDLLFILEGAGCQKQSESRRIQDLPTLVSVTGGAIPISRFTGLPPSVNRKTVATNRRKRARYGNTHH